MSVPWIIVAILCFLGSIWFAIQYLRKFGFSWWPITLIIMTALNLALQFLRGTIFFGDVQVVFCCVVLHYLVLSLPHTGNTLNALLQILPRKRAKKTAKRHETSGDSMLFVFVDMDSNEKIVEGTLMPLSDESHRISAKREEGPIQ